MPAAESVMVPENQEAAIREKHNRIILGNGVR